MEEFHAHMKGTFLQEWTQRTILEVQRVKPDILVGYYGSTAGFCAAAAAKFLDYPVVVCLRGNDVNRDLFSAMWTQQLQFSVQKADAVVTVSTEMKRKIAAWMGVKAVFISNSVDKEVFYPDPEGAKRFKEQWKLGDRPIIGLFGEFKPTRGISILNHLKEALSDVAVMVVGEVREAYKSSIPSWIFKVPYITDIGALRGAYSACDIVLHPSNHDGMPNVVLEAMACERVVVTSRTGGLTDLISHGKNGFFCDTLEEWAAGIKRLILKPEPELGKKASLWVPCPEDEKDNFVRLFEQVLKNRGKNLSP